jgi:hypothetical protein
MNKSARDEEARADWAVTGAILELTEEGKFWVSGNLRSRVVGGLILSCSRMMLWTARVPR